MKNTMKQTRLLKTVFGILAVTLAINAYAQESKPAPASAPPVKSSSAASPSSAEVALNNYYRDQASKQIEQILPKGKFGVQVSLKVNATRIKSDFEIEPVKLPLGDSFVTGNEIKASGLVDQSLERLISYVEKVDVTVSVAPGISTQVQELITNSLKQMLLIDMRRGDTITFNELPDAILTAWNPEPSIEIYKKPAMILSGYFGLILLFVAMAVMFGFRQIGMKITREAGALTGTIREAIENSLAMGGGMQTPSAMGASPQPSAIKFEGAEPVGANFWEKVESESVIAFCFDCISQPTYMAVPSMMVGGILDPSKANEVEARIPSEYVMGFTGKMNLKNNDVTALFQKYQSEYRRAVRSSVSKQLVETDLEKIVEFSKDLGSVEIALLLNSLTPLKRGGLLKSLSTEMKLDVAKASQEHLSPVELKKHELSLVEKIEKVVGTSKKKDESLSLNYLTSIILHAESFAEDEALYEKMGAGGDYQGVLLAFECFSDQNWEEFNLQDLVIAFCGYSEKYRDALVSKFSGKKVDWVKNFLLKYQANQPDFRSAQVEAVHEMIKNRITAIQGAKSEDRQAA